MSEMSQTIRADLPATMPRRQQRSMVLWRNFIIGLIAFLTVVDLFATQAILPSLAQAYNVTPAAMGFAVNASTLGMAVAGLSVALFSRHINRRLGILIALCVLAIPTTLLAWAPDLTTFTILRIAQGLCMASAFTLTLAYLGEECSAMAAGGAFAAYITGNVASNLIGRLISAGVADHLGTCGEFLFLRGAQPRRRGAGLFHHSLDHADGADERGLRVAARRLDRTHLRNPPLRAAFGIGFCILFAFIGTFTYVNFVLVREPLSLGKMALGLCLSRVSAVRCDHALCRARGAALRHATDLLERARPGGLGSAAVAVAESPCRDHGPDADRHRHILRAGSRNRLRRQGRDSGSRFRERHLSRMLFSRRSRRQRGARTIVRSLRLGRVCRRHCVVADRCFGARVASQACAMTEHVSITPR